MFSQAFVILFMGGGEVYTPPGQADTAPSAKQATPPPGPGRHPTAPLPRQTATAADGTHPTGMHSCLEKFLSKTAIK